MSFLKLHELNPAQALAAGVFFTGTGKLILVYPRQYGGKTEFGCRLSMELLETGTSGSSLLIAKDQPSLQRAVREKFTRLSQNGPYSLNSKQISHAKNPLCVHQFASIDRDPNRARGSTLRFLHWSETAFAKIDTGQSIMDVYQQVLLPTLTKADGRVLIETTLNGYNGFKDFYDEAPRMGFNILHLGLDDFVKLNIITQAEYEKAEAKYHPDYFRQEFLCQWVTYTGAAYPEFDAGHIAEIEPPKDGEPIYVSIDWGYSPSATAVLFGVYRGNQLQVYAEHYALQEHAHTTAQRIQEETLRFPACPLRIVGDHEPDRMDTLRAHGIQAANADKREVLGSRTRIKELLYFDRLVMSPTCTYLRRDLQSAVWSGKKDGEIDSKICTWGHYDCEAALRYMIDSFGFI